MAGQALQPATVYNSENYLHLKEHVQETPAVRNQRFFGYFDINGDGKISAIEVYFYALSMTLLHDHEKVIHTTSTKILEQVHFFPHPLLKHQGLEILADKSPKIKNICDKYKK